ncbi:hypothetical protein F9C07_11365 [Aspergillus flavus]|uniref:Uncharacterized protein n=1 Tax=Aspergillus flavus (strain ATCC 200026 / FGSC A1120 / IAM 13836 / NRRL 3357 / JCM 12722 / SRRC 167) TaxID=332952 RepID=A0A7U2QYF8_ASPFN|nr:hypothetical protein F9C07_11365 [Aspergillus flavus]
MRATIVGWHRGRVKSRGGIPGHRIPRRAKHRAARISQDAIWTMRIEGHREVVTGTTQSFSDTQDFVSRQLHPHLPVRRPTTTDPSLYLKARHGLWKI